VGLRRPEASWHFDTNRLYRARAAGGARDGQGCTGRGCTRKVARRFGSRAVSTRETPSFAAPPHGGCALVVLQRSYNNRVKGAHQDDWRCSILTPPPSPWAASSPLLHDTDPPPGADLPPRDRLRPGAHIRRKTLLTGAGPVCAKAAANGRIVGHHAGASQRAAVF
jgi:hypothetical protein